MTIKVEHNSVCKRLLICGLGSIGRRHARIFNELLPQTEISVCRSGYGKDTPELEIMSNIFYDLTTAIAWKPDAAIIASPAPYHQHQALLLAKNKIPTLIEKPLGVGLENKDEWEELLHYSKNQTIAVGYVLRHDPCALYVKEMIEGLELGNVIEADLYCGSWLPEWRPDSDYREGVSSRRSMGGGALLELSHEIDLAYWFLGDFDITFASLRQSGLLNIDVEDQVLLIGSSSKGSLITIRTNFCTLPARRRVLVRCEKGEISWNILKGEVDVYSLTRGFHKFKDVKQHDDNYRLQAKRFISSISNNHPPYCSLSDGLQVMKLINQARMKAVEPGLD